MSAPRPEVGTFTITVNGRIHQVEAEEDTPLLWVLRDQLGLLGTRYGCGIGVCGSCAVLEGDQTVRTCRLWIRSAAGRSFTTIEGLSADGSHPVQRAWIEEDVSQCGYCQSGMILAAVALLRRNPHPTAEDIDAALSSTLCRCGSYQRVRRAVRRAAATS